VSDHLKELEDLREYARKRGLTAFTRCGELDNTIIKLKGREPIDEFFRSLGESLIAVDIDASVDYRPFTLERLATIIAPAGIRFEHCSMTQRETLILLLDIKIVLQVMLDDVGTGTPPPIKAMEALIERLEEATK